MGLLDHIYVVEAITDCDCDLFVAEVILDKIDGVSLLLRRGSKKNDRVSSQQNLAEEHVPHLFLQLLD